MAPKTILVIDDEAVIREVIQECLKELAGWQVWSASSGKEGLELAKTKPFDAILLDVSMPGMNGFDTLQALKADPATHAIPVILLTAMILPPNQEAIAQKIVAGVITKPFEPLTLVNAIAEIMM